MQYAERVESRIRTRLDRLQEAARGDDLWVPRKIDDYGKSRILHYPADEFMGDMQGVARVLYDGYPHPPYSHGGIKDRNIFTNAEPHRQSRLWMGVDLKGAYYQINSDRLMETLSHHGFSSSFIDDLQEVVLHLDALPIGSPPSTILFNMAMDYFDRELMRLYECSDVMTRFIDDYTFSWAEYRHLQDRRSGRQRIKDRFHDAGFTISSTPVTDVKRQGISMPGVVLVPADGQLHQRVMPRYLKKRTRGMRHRHQTDPAQHSPSVLENLDTLEDQYDDPRIRVRT